MPVFIESKRSHLHLKPHQIWQVTAYSTFIAALFSISVLGYSHDLKIAGVRPIPKRTNVRTIARTNVRTSVRTSTT